MNSAALIATCNSRALDKVEKAVMFALSVHFNDHTKQCNPSIPTLCDDTGFGRTAVFDARIRLVKKGVLEIQNVGYRKSSNYSFDLSKMPEDVSKTKWKKVVTSPSAEPVEVAKPASIGGVTGPPHGLTSPLDGLTGPPHGLTGPPAGPEVISEVIKEINKGNRGDHFSEVGLRLESTNSKTELGFNFDNSQSRSQENDSKIGLDLAGKVDAVLGESPPMTAVLFFDDYGRPKSEAILSTLCQRERAKPYPATRKQLQAIANCATQWLRTNRMAETGT